MLLIFQQGCCPELAAQAPAAEPSLALGLNGAGETDLLHLPMATFGQHWLHKTAQNFYKEQRQNYFLWENKQLRIS